MKKPFITNLVYIIVIFLLVSCSEVIRKDPYPNFTFPIITGGFDEKTTWEEDIISKQTTYIIKSNIAPHNVFEFYNNYFSPHFEPNMKNIFPHELEENIDYLVEGDWLTPPARYIKGWLNKDKTMVIKITAFYQSLDETYITCFMHPYSDLTGLTNFTKELESNGKINEMIELTNRYKKSNGNFDLEKAKKVKNKSLILERLIELIEKDSTQIQSNYQRFINK